MFTEWGKKTVLVCGGANLIRPAMSTYSGKACIAAKTCAGNNVYINGMAAAASYGLITSFTETGISASSGIAFGSSDQAESANDYSVVNLITGITAQTPSVVSLVSNENDKYIARLDYTISNNNASDITIREFGFFVACMRSSTKGGDLNNTNTNRRCIMIDRTVLETPVTIPAGQAGVVRVEYAYPV